MKCKRFLTLVLTAVMSVGLAACGTKTSKSTASSKKSASGDASLFKNTVLYIVPDTNEGVKDAFSEAIRKQAQKDNVDLILERSGDDVDNQVKQIEMAKKTGYGGLVIWPADPKTAHQLELAAGDTPIVFVNNQPADDDLKEGKYVYVGSPDSKAGEYEAEYVYEKLGRPKSLKLMLLKGKKSAASTANRANAVKKYFADKKVDVDYVFADFADDSSAKAFLMLKSFKLTKQTFDAAICTNDEMALGVVQYMQMNHLDPGSVPVCGVGGSLNTLVSVAGDGISFTAGVNASGQAKAAVKAITSLMKGTGIEGIDNSSKDGKYIWIPYNKIDKSNAIKFMKE